MAKYELQILKQLQESIMRIDKLEQKCHDLSSELKIVKKENKYLKKENERLNKKVAEQAIIINEQAQKITDLENENTILKDEIDRLTGKDIKDSTNSSIPPSKDEKRKNINLREKTGKKTGGQKGHPGSTLTKKYVEETILKNPDTKLEIVNHGNPKKGKYTKKYEIDIKTIVVIKEHRFYYNNKKELHIPEELKSQVTYSNNLKTLCNVMIVEEVISLKRISEFIEILTNNLLSISQGSLINWLEKCSDKCKGTIESIADSLKNSNLIYTDLTETTVDGKKAYVRNYSTEKLTLLKACVDKKKKRISEHKILTSFMGKIMHDHDTALYSFGQKDNHCECLVHEDRYLLYNTEYVKSNWAKEMSGFFKRLKRGKEESIAINVYSFNDEKINEINKEYDKIVEQGYSENKLLRKSHLKSEEKALLNKLTKYKKSHLLFIEDFSVPYDNNLSERDLRAIKTKKKVSGMHKAFESLVDYCNIRSIISTCKKQGLNYWHILSDIMNNNPITISV